MRIERFEIPGLAQYSYVVSAGGSALVVDPIRDIDRYLAYAADQSLNITHVTETHIHADFASGATALVAATGAELALSGYDADQHYRYAMPHRALDDGDCIEVGSVTVKALHTPGHTPEHLSFLIFDKKRSADVPVALLSGDFLFVGSLGRPDLLGEAEKQGLARQLYLSLSERIASIPDAVELYPGHGAGSLCGAGMGERAESTLGYERATNPMFQMEETAFTAEILRTVPPMPVYYPRMKSINAVGAAVLAAVPGGTVLSVNQVAELALQPDVVLLDLRRPEAFGGAHISGAINIGLGQNLSLWAGWLLDPEKRIVLISDGGDDESSRRSLMRVGLDRTIGYLKGGMNAWIEAGLSLARTVQVDAVQVSTHPDDTLIVDVRSDGEWRAGHIEGARHMMLGDLRRLAHTLPPTGSLIAVCGSGYRSSIAASILAASGRESVSSMAGGMSAWRRQKLPVVVD